MSRRNDYQRVLSQLFDVRPMKNSADLDWEIIKRVEGVLDLRGRTTKNEIRMRREALILGYAKKATELRERESVVFVKKDSEYDQEKAVGIKRAPFSSELLFDDYFAGVETRKKAEDEELIGSEEKGSAMDWKPEKEELIGEIPVPYDEPLLIKENWPSREEILRELEEVETRDRYINYDYEYRHQRERQEDITRDFFGDEIDLSDSAPPTYVKRGLASFIVIALAISLSFPIASFLARGSNIQNEALIAGISTNNPQDVGYFLSDFDFSGREPFDKFIGFLGKNGQKYLLLFQDSREERATGGLVDVYGIMEIKSGEVAGLSVGDVLGLDSQLNVNVVPPRPLQKIATVWSLHDANWFPDFPISAEKSLWFYERVSGEKLDGVITFTPLVIARLLEITGPVDMPEYGISVTHNNFLKISGSKKGEDFGDILTQSQNILIDFIPRFIKKLDNQNSNNWDKITEIFIKSLNERHILMFFTAEEPEKFALSQGWGGVMRKTEGDFLTVVSSSLDGYKIDYDIDERIFHSAEIQQDGSVIDTLNVVRANKSGSHADLNYLRVYTPLGSELLEAEGGSLEEYKAPIDYAAHNFELDSDVGEVESGIVAHSSGAEIFHESGKTVFGNWIYVAPGQSAAITYKYKLPLSLAMGKNRASYVLTVQKQSGSIGSSFEGTVRVPDKFLIIDKSVNLIDKYLNTFEVTQELKTDLAYWVKSY